MKAPRIALGLVALVLTLPAVTPASACQVAANLIANCGFPTDTANWSILNVGGTWGTLAFSGSDGATPGTGPGSAEVVAAMNGPGDFRAGVMQCIGAATGVPDVPTDTYNAGGDARLVTAAIGDASCSMDVVGFTSNDCSTGLVAPASGSGSFAVGNTWVQGNIPGFAVVSIPNVLSVRLFIACTHTVPFTMHFDDLFFGVGLTPVELQSFTIE
jgi:hypothetical protein